jgi:oligopeptide/dipeptide ABC transporter ATP-binding protein
MVSDRGAVPLLAVRGLTVRIPLQTGEARVVNGVDLEIAAGSTVALVGESGSGKSMLARAVMGLLPRDRMAVSGSIMFNGLELLDQPEAELRRIRGNQIAMVFQDPMRSLDPIMTVGAQIVEALSLHGNSGRSEARKRAVELLEIVRMPLAQERLDSYPHQLSGGMRQRVMIAIALSCSPQLLIADEPTTALDVTTQATIMDLLADLQRDLNMAVLLITHDLFLAASYTEAISVMYAGRILERLPSRALFEGASVPYTVGLMNSIPTDDDAPHSLLRTIPGTRPDPGALPTGCEFHTRCDLAGDRCRLERPILVPVSDEHWRACWHPLTTAGVVPATGAENHV